MVADRTARTPRNTWLLTMNSWVRFCLFTITATRGGSDVTCTTVFTICPLSRSPS